MGHNCGISDRGMVLLNGLRGRIKSASVNTRQCSAALPLQSRLTIAIPVVRSSFADVIAQINPRHQTGEPNTDDCCPAIATAAGSAYGGTGKRIYRSTDEGKTGLNTGRPPYHDAKVHSVDSDNNSEAARTVGTLVPTTARSCDCATHSSDTFRGCVAVRAGSIGNPSSHNQGLLYPSNKYIKITGRVVYKSEQLSRIVKIDTTIGGRQKFRQRITRSTGWEKTADNMVEGKV